MGHEVDAPSAAPATSTPVADSVTVLTATSPADLIDFEEELSKAVHLRGDAPPMSVAWAFRGQSKMFGTLAPSFRRRFEGKKSVKTIELIEAELIKAFRAHYANLKQTMRDMPLQSAIDQGKELRCLSVMQHYGVPTRLLDWTADIWTALYFACAGDPEDDAELWCYNRDLFLTNSEMATKSYQILPSTAGDQFADPPILQRRDIDLVIEAGQQLTPRMIQQKAHHTVAANVLADHAPLIQRTLADSGNGSVKNFQRVVIAQRAKDKVLKYLNEHKDISAGSIFPDFEGLGRFLRWQLDSLITTLL